MTSPEYSPRKGDIVTRRDDTASQPRRGVVTGMFHIGPEDLVVRTGWWPVEQGLYAAVIWYGRKRMRLEPADDLQKNGSLSDWF
jgi:hypothetical protein